MTFRIEEKIPMTKLDSAQFIESLKKQGLQTLYPARIIHSNYFDSVQYDLFRDSEEGLLPRKKVRIRHYPLVNLDKHTLEIKISSIEGRYKNTTSLSSSDMKKINRLGYYDSMYGQLEKKVSVTYSREYYSFEGVRITRDTQILYQDLQCKSNNFRETDSVVEIKAPKDTSLDFLLRIIPSKRRRFSKFCNAIQYLKLT